MPLVSKFYDEVTIIRCEMICQNSRSIQERFIFARTDFVLFAYSVFASLGRCFVSCLGFSYT